MNAKVLYLILNLPGGGQTPHIDIPMDIIRINIRSKCFSAIYFTVSSLFYFSSCRYVHLLHYIQYFPRIIYSQNVAPHSTYCHSNCLISFLSYIYHLILQILLYLFPSLLFLILLTSSPQVPSPIHRCIISIQLCVVLCFLRNSVIFCIV